MGGFMQQLATVSSSGAAVTYDNGVFAVGGEAVGIEKVMEYDRLGVLKWANEETKTWLYQTAQTAPAIPQPAAAAAPMGGAEKPKKPWYKKWWVWAIAVVILFVAIGSAGNKGTTTTPAPTSPAASTPAQKPAEQKPAEQPAAAPAQAPAEQTAKIGTPLKVGDLTFTVTAAKPITKLTSVLGNKTGDWVLVTATVKNGSKEAVMIDSSFFKLLSADGSAYETDSDNLMYLPTDKNFFLAKINPNLSKSGQVLFAVPPGSKPSAFKLQVQTGVFGTQTGEIALIK